MVLFKRKPVRLQTLSTTIDKDAEIWAMPRTGEIFMSYEAYLHRYDFYRQKKFTCEITGYSKLSFFEAWESEAEGSRSVELNFPDALREPLLRKVQFSTISRLDDLVAYLFDVFREDFFPGEPVMVLVSESEKAHGVIRDKASFPRIERTDGTVEREAISRYFVVLRNRTQNEILVDNKQIFRDRRAFSKHVLRCFLKNNVQRESWSGAPWTVKPEIAHTYHIDSTIPVRLQQETVAAEKKAIAALKRGITPQRKLTPQQMAQQKLYQHQQYRQALATTLPNASNFMHPQEKSSNRTKDIAFVDIDTPLTVKYPIEDLEIHPSADPSQRPQLKSLHTTTLNASDMDNPISCNIKSESVGPLLEIWNTLNVHCEVFKLDSFTFDDFVDAMAFSFEDLECELFVEIHCSVLKLLIDEDGHLEVDLPVDSAYNDTEEDSGIEDDSTIVATSEIFERYQGDKRTRARLRRTETVDRNLTSSANSTLHMAPELLVSNDWREMLKQRDFRNGGWQVVMVGLLLQNSFKASLKGVCDQILAVLLPVSLPPTQDTVRKQYCQLDINLRTAALEIVCVLAVQTTKLREYIEECSDQMTMLRKQKVECQRAKKVLFDELKSLDEEKELLLPKEFDLPVQASEPPDVEPTAEPDAALNESADTDEDLPQEGPSLRHANERKRKRDEDISRKEREKKMRAEAAKEPPRVRKIRKDIEKKRAAVREYEERISTLDEDLRENACQRTKVLGRDRFWNRYYWFERNGMPFGGIPSSSTSDYGYANGRLWVQGPDDIECDGFIQLAEPELSHYRLKFGISVTERKRKEEGGTSLLNARQWGFIDNVDGLDALIAWLDDRGRRERELKKELQIWRDQIVKQMQKLQDRLAEATAKIADSEEPVVGVATRQKTYFDQSSGKHPSLNWRNTYALSELGHLHVDGPRARKADKRTSCYKKDDFGADKPLQVRSGSRYG